VTGKLIPLLLIAASVLTLAGCNRDAEVNAALSEVDAFTAELVERVTKAKETVIGIDDAQKYLDSRKSDIQPKAAFLARIRGIQVGAETQKKMVEAVKRDQMLVSNLQSNYMSTYMNDPVFRTKLEKLVHDYLDLFQA